jgi:hypothetical protein
MQRERSAKKTLLELFVHIKVLLLRQRVHRGRQQNSMGANRADVGMNLAATKSPQRKAAVEFYACSCSAGALQELTVPALVVKWLYYI